MKSDYFLQKIDSFSKAHKGLISHNAQSELDAEQNRTDACWFNKQAIIPTFLNKNDVDIATASVRPSIRPSRYLLLDGWSDFNQI